MSFRFKQFFIEDSKCAMKVGTDGVLLGAWAPINGERLEANGERRILDVGTGSGLIARMMMQRCPKAEVEGIDIDPNAVTQARENGVKAYLSRLQDWHASIQPSAVSIQKVLREGVIYIEREGKTYDMNGRMVNGK